MRLALLLVIGVALLYSWSATAQTEAELEQSAAATLTREDLPAPETLTDKLQEAKKNTAPGSLVVADTLQALAEIARQQGAQERAIQLHLEALGIREQVLGTESPAVADSLDRLGRLYFKQGSLGNARAAIQRVVTILTAQSTPSNKLAQALQNLAFIQVQKGETKAAEALYLRALDVYAEAPDAVPWHRAGTLNNLADLYRGEGRFESAEPTYLQALELATQVRGSEHRFVQGILQNLAQVQTELWKHNLIEERPGAAWDVYQRSIAPYSDQPMAGIDIASRYGRIAAERGRFASAERVLLHSLPYIDKHASADDPKHLGSRRVLAHVARSLGKPAESLHWVVEALAVSRRLHLDLAEWEGLASEVALESEKAGSPGLASDVYALMIKQARQKANLNHSELIRLYFRVGEMESLQDKLSKASNAYSHAIEIALKHEPQNSLLLVLYNQLGLVLGNLGRPAEAERAFSRAVALLRAQPSPDAEKLYVAEINLSDMYRDQRNHEQAAALLKVSAARLENTAKKVPELIVDSQSALGRSLDESGETAQAATHFDRALAVIEANPELSSPRVGDALLRIGRWQQRRGLFAKAEASYRRALDWYRRTTGENSLPVARALESLSELALDGHSGREEAVATLQKAIGVREQISGSDSVHLVPNLIVLAKHQSAMDQWDAAAHSLQRAQLIAETSWEEGQPMLLEVLDEQAGLTLFRGWLDEAEAIALRAADLAEARFSDTDNRVARSLMRLAGVYTAQQRAFDASRVYRQIIERARRAHPPDELTAALAVMDLAGAYASLGMRQETIPMLEHGVKIFESEKGEHNVWVAVMLEHLAAGYSAVQRYDDAERVLRRALTIRKQLYGQTHPALASTIGQMAQLKIDQKKYKEARAFFERSIDIAEAHPDERVARMRKLFVELAFGDYLRAARQFKKLTEDLPDEQLPEIAQTPGVAAIWALFEAVLGDLDGALARVRRADRRYRTRAIEATRRDPSRLGLSTLPTPLLSLVHMGLLEHALRAKPDQRAKLQGESFEAAQMARNTSTSQAVARMAARFAAGSDELALRVRERQQTMDAWRALDWQLAQRASVPAEDAAARDTLVRLQAELDVKRKRIAKLDADLATDFPEYAQLTNPQPVPLPELQTLLAPDEAMVFYLSYGGISLPTLDAFISRIVPSRTLVWLVKREEAVLEWLEVDADQLEEKVKVLRQSLDPQLVRDLSDIVEYPTAVAHQLYKLLVAPIETQLTGVKHLLVVPNRALQSLPFEVLVTEEPKEPIQELSDHRHLAWLTRRYAVTVLPSVGSLRALRRFARYSTAPDPFTGFGDPVLTGCKKKTRGVNVAELLTRNARADVEAVRALCSLPGTADELLAVARRLGAGPETVHLQESATEARVKSLDLERFRVLSFATHGLIAGDFEGLAEPALVLTPPGKASIEDDGLLTASEVAQLNLNADWVILSACNTAAADGTPGAPGLSGLAKAFFYAGSRSLLVSHWNVFSTPTIRLIQSLFNELAANPGLRRSEALRRAKISLMNNRQASFFAHPIFWGPFSLVGEGGPSVPTARH